jgi:hypothetical protein
MDDLVPDYATGSPVCLRKEHLNHIQNEIINTFCPSYATIPPPGMGTAGSGKLKAGEWLAAYEFDLPVTLACILATDKTLTKGMRELIYSTLYLAMAICFALSNTTFAAHCDKYLHYYGKYMEIIWKLYPLQRLRPNQHAAFHFADFLRRFGPARGFWMLPYERVIGRLQSMDTNFIPGTFCLRVSSFHPHISSGQMEKTMLKSYSTASNLWVFLDDVDNKSTPELAKLRGHLIHALNTKTRGPVNLEEPNHPVDGCVDTVSKPQKGWILLDNKTYKACGSMELAQRADFQGAFPRQVVAFSTHMLCGALFTDIKSSRSKSKASSLVYFRSAPDKSLAPGQVQSIFATVHSIPSSSKFHLQYFFAIRPFVDGNIADKLLHTTFANFGARLYWHALGDIVVV